MRRHKKLIRDVVAAPESEDSGHTIEQRVAEIAATGTSDDIEDALNYRSVTKDVIAHVETSSHYLVEALATELARICVVEHGAQRARVRVEKPAALRFSDSVGIEIER